MSNVVETVRRAADHHRRGQLAEAEAGYRDALKRAPKNADALHLLGTIVAGQGKALDGAALIEQSLSIMPSSPEAHYNLANIYAGLYRFADAERHFREAFRLRPTHAAAANGVGGAALRLGRHDDAELWLRKALGLDPRDTNALVNMGSLMDATGRFNETIAYYDQAIALQPQQSDAHQFKALALLTRGQFTEGWKEFVWRFQYAPAFHGRFPFPYWRGEDLAGRKILVWTDQGLGDEILGVSMIPDLINKGARVTLLCSARLSSLFSRSFPNIEVIAVGQPTRADALHDVAFQASMSNLGEYLRPDFNTFPRENTFLKSDAALSRALREKYKAAGKDNLLVGLSWRSVARDGGREKTIPLERWAPVLTVPGVTFVNLQYGDTAAERAAMEKSLGVKIISDSDVDPSGDMTAFAAQVAALDLTLTVSNTTAHIAGSMGAPAYVLIPADSGRLWYWFLERADSPWYPSLRLLRQRKNGWSDIMDELAAKLAAHRSIETPR